MVEINALPDEMLMRVFKWGTLMDRKNVVLVSKRWRDVGEDPSLWNWCMVKVRNREDISKLSTRRLRYIQEIRIETRTSDNWQDGDLESLFQAVMNLPRLKKLDLGENNLSTVNPELFVKALNRLEDVNLKYTHISIAQAKALFKAMVQNSQLKKLDLKFNNLSTVNPVVLATAVMKLETVDLRYTKLNTEQITSILKHVLEDINLKKLWLEGNDIMDVDIDVMRKAWEKLGDGLNINQEAESEDDLEEEEDLGEEDEDEEEEEEGESEEGEEEEDDE